MRWLAPWVPAGVSLAVVAFGLAAGCGGKVVVDVSGSGGGGGGGGSSSSSSSSSTSASSTTSSTTSSSSSTTTSSSTGGLPCPDPFPGIEGSCPEEGQQCAVPNACCGGVALCKGGYWTFAGPFCSQPCTPECGPDGFACQAGTLCVTYIGPITTYTCAISPCFEMVSCGCVEALCAEKMMTCNNIQDGYKVLCD